MTRLRDRAKQLDTPFLPPQFDVNWEALEEGLDRFAQFFIGPLISHDGIEREVGSDVAWRV